MTEKSQINIAIIGGGIGGISAAIGLKEKLGFTNFTIYEKASEIGGTWRDNIYPGCACDVPSHWYSLSSEMNPNWSQYYSNQPEILEYWKTVSTKHNLYTKIKLNTYVVAATWNNAEQVWNLEYETGGERDTATANIIISAANGFVLPGYADLKGRDLFQGPAFHSSRWDYNIDLHGKRIGVIGNGCSAAQFIPKITEDPTVRVVNFCRTPNWFVPRPQKPYSAITKWIFRNIPLTARLYRVFIVLINDSVHFIWKKKFAKIRKIGEMRSLAHMRKKAPKKYHDVLTPDYPLGCKRIIIDPGYYEALHRPNIELAWGGVREIVEDGLITNDGVKHELDIIIYGTGFLFLNPKLRVTGRNGLDLYDYFDSRGGPEAYLGTTVPGFPNLYTLLGPNVASGHSSAVYSEELQIQYALQLIRPVIEGKARSFEVRKATSDGYNEDLQRRLLETTWSTCQSYYRASGVGKIVAVFPGSIFRQWLLFRKVNYEEYVGVDVEEWERERQG